MRFWYRGLKWSLDPYDITFLQKGDVVGDKGPKWPKMAILDL